MITITFTIPSIPAQWILGITLVLGPLLLLAAVQFAFSAGSFVRRLTK
jgi:hypothetical protein